jgi:hypothetical protein
MKVFRQNYDGGDLEWKRSFCRDECVAEYLHAIDQERCCSVGQINVKKYVPPGMNARR